MSDAGSGAALALSVVIPAYNERTNVEPCYRELVDVLERLGQSFEVLFVDDGSTDGTDGALRKLAAKDPRVRVLRFRRNAGQSGDDPEGVMRLEDVDRCLPDRTGATRASRAERVQPLGGVHELPRLPPHPHVRSGHWVPRSLLDGLLCVPRPGSAPRRLL